MKKIYTRKDSYMHNICLKIRKLPEGSMVCIEDFYGIVPVKNFSANARNLIPMGILEESKIEKVGKTRRRHYKILCNRFEFAFKNPPRVITQQEIVTQMVWKDLWNIVFCGWRNHEKAA